MNILCKRRRRCTHSFSPRSRRRPASGSHPQLASILVIDDDQGVRDIFAQILTSQGYTVHTALNAERGLREANRSHPDLILLDFQMPGGDGLTFLRRFRACEDQRRTPVAMITGEYFLADAVVRELRELGAELHFKPLRLDAIIGITQALLQGAP